MNRSSTTREAWHPQTVQEREIVLRELQEVLASPHFCNSKRYPALLKYVVEKTLAGEGDQLKERTLGVEVFERPADYDTNADTVVRYTAGEVRKRLSLYYHELGRRSPIHISLPTGSYVPEFVPAQDAEFTLAEELNGSEERGEANAVREPEFGAGEWHGRQESRVHTGPARARRTVWKWWAVAGAVGVAALAGGWRYRTLHVKTPLEDFWAPVLREQANVMVYIGGSVFDQSHTSGVSTASKDTDYPFVSMQSASAVAQLSTLLARQAGVATELRFAASTPLTELRDHPVVLVGGYNNQWTIRLLDPLRYHFLPNALAEVIVDAKNPAHPWERDASLPYSSADDYGLVARFRDATTDSWVMALAGVGRNGTEAAAHFATSPHYIEELRERLGGDFGARNVEVVLKASVIEGKTGAPVVQAVYVW